tara:strand:+ start:93 stop:539 length:447 start_codon:yes stop_codon:yes gene_type:complete
MKNALFYLLISTLFLMPLSAGAISLRCEHEKDIFFQLLTNDGETINKRTNSKKDTQKFTLKLKGQTCVRIHDNNKESMSNPLNYFQLTKTKSSYICSSSVKLSKDKKDSPVVSTLTIDRNSGVLISFSNIGIIRIKKQFQCKTLGPVI